jgi:hypothetical protein
MAEEKKERPIVGFLRDAAFAVIGGIVIEPTLARLRIDISHYLPQVWLIIFGFVTVDGLMRSKKLRRWAVERDESQTTGWRIMTYLLVAVIGALLFSACWFSITKLLSKPPDELGAESTPSSSQSSGSKTIASEASTPSLLFVFGAPLGDNDSAKWIMAIKHYGPEDAHNCQIDFYDDDRKNIEHEWLVKHPDSPYPPPGLAGQSQHSVYVAEASREGSVGSFIWDPVNTNSQHYTVSISCRAGLFVEKWAITRVNGILRSQITIEHGAQWMKDNPTLEPTVFRYEDPEFIKTALATEMPKASIGKVVHPGWKPLHKFAVPSAILDPNGNIQVVVGVKLPDGSTKTDFGSWNILTRHFGGAKDPSK